jgi:hypothetical protein
MAMCASILMAKTLNVDEGDYIGEMATTMTWKMTWKMKMTE